MDRFRALAVCGVSIGCLATATARAQTHAVDPASGPIFVVPHVPAPQFQGAAFAATATAGFAVGPNADFHGWFRYPDSETKPQTEADFVAGGAPFLGVEDGPRAVLVNDWAFAWKATFRCPTAGSAEQWFATLDGPIFVGGGFLVSRRQQVSVSFDASCNLFVTVNGVLFRQITGTPGLQAEVIAVAPLDRCEQGLLGRPWSFTLSHDGTLVSLPEADMTAHPEVRSAGAQLLVSSDVLTLFPEMPNENDTTKYPHGGSPGFTDQGHPGETASVEVAVRDVACAAGLAGVPPVEVPLPGIAADVSFRYEPQSGGHSHPNQTPPVSPFFSVALGPVHTLLNDLDLAAVSPGSPALSFDAATGHLFEATGSDGAISFQVNAGQVAGVFDVGATATGTTTLLVPGGVVAPADPLAIFVEFRGSSRSPAIPASTT